MLTVPALVRVASVETSLQPGSQDTQALESLYLITFIYYGVSKGYQGVLGLLLQALGLGLLLQALGLPQDEMSGQLAPDWLFSKTRGGVRGDVLHCMTPF